MDAIEFSCREATPSDAPTIQEFQQAMAWETEKLRLDTSIVAAGVHAVFAKPEHGTYYVCTGAKGVVGCLLITKEWSDWRNGAVWWIQSVYLRPEVRGLKLFSKMYRYIQELAQANLHVRGIRLYVDRSNTKAQAIYKQIGMNGDHYRLFEWMKST